MDATVGKSTVSGSAAAPASKSFSHRAIILASLAKGTSRISNLLLSDDTLLTLEACKALGAKLERKDAAATITGFSGTPKTKERTAIFLGNSGTSMRLLASVAGLSKTPVVLDGDARMRERPIGDLLVALNASGIAARSLRDNDCPPVEISCPKGLGGGEISVSGAVSSQFISSLLLVAPLAKKPTIIRVVDELKSRPYVDVTIALMGKFGARVREIDQNVFSVDPAGAYKPQSYAVEGDYSSASYFFAAAAVTKGKVTVSGLNADSLQADAKFLDILSSMGAGVVRRKGAITVEGKGQLQGAGTIDCSKCPDIVQTICAVAACATGKTRMERIGHLRAKESDRISDTVRELKKFGVDAREGPDWIEVNGTGRESLRGAAVDSHRDHRMAMAFTVLGLAAGGTVIRGSECVSKSFPDFFERMRAVGAAVEQAAGSG